MINTLCGKKPNKKQASCQPVFILNRAILETTVGIHVTPNYPEREGRKRPAGFQKITSSRFKVVFLSAHLSYTTIHLTSS